MQLTPLMAAVESRDILMVKMLANACKGLVNHEDKTALCVALEEALLLMQNSEDEQAIRAFSFNLTACEFLSQFSEERAGCLHSAKLLGKYGTHIVENIALSEEQSDSEWKLLVPMP